MSSIAALLTLLLFVLPGGVLSMAFPSHQLIRSTSLNQTTLNCTSFAKTVPLDTLNATFINATSWPVDSYELSGISNGVMFCEIHASVQYGLNNTLNLNLWLPAATKYHDRFMAVGNGAFAGTIDTLNMLRQLNNGYGMAVAGSDSGHSAKLNNGGVGIPSVHMPFLHDQSCTEAWLHNSIAIFTPVAKLLIEAYYSTPPAYSYYDGCSSGGAQGFALAQFHPGLFDGIYAGSPGNWYSHLALSFLWNAQHTNTTAANLNLKQLIAITDAVLDVCDTLDGVEDRTIENPLRCHFDIQTLACKATSNPLTCLHPGQIKAVQAIYAGATRSDTGAQVYPGMSFGSEVGWFMQTGLLADVLTIPMLQNLVFNNLSYDSNTFNWASDVTVVDQQAGVLLDAINPDLSFFQSAGGKMISTQGWADPLNAGLWPVEHLGQLQESMGGDVSDFYQLFMVPGGGHCGSQISNPHTPGTYHRVPLLVDWVENGNKPSQMLSTDPPFGNATRKLCPWPSEAVYGDGDIDDWGSYTCEKVNGTH